MAVETTDATYNYDDLYVSNETQNDLGFLGQYSNEKFISRKTRKARITYAPDTRVEENVEIGKEYSIGYVPARGILVGVWAIVQVDTAEAAVATVKLGATTVHTAPTDTAGASTTDVAIADGYVADLTEMTISFDAAVTPAAGSITIVYEYLDAETIEGPFGS